MSEHRAHRRVDAQGVLDEFEEWLLRERSAQARTARAYTDRVVGFTDWLAAPVGESLRKLTAATVIEWVNEAAGKGYKASTLGKWP